MEKQVNRRDFIKTAAGATAAASSRQWPNCVAVCDVVTIML